MGNHIAEIAFAHKLEIDVERVVVASKLGEGGDHLARN